jgi:hypothetical protein
MDKMLSLDIMIEKDKKAITAYGDNLFGNITK